MSNLVRTCHDTFDLIISICSKLSSVQHNFLMDQIHKHNMLLKKSSNRQYTHGNGSTTKGVQNVQYNI